MFPALATRRVAPERMDDPALPAADHARALAGLRRIHFWTRTTAAVWQVVRRWMLDRPEPGSPFRLLDVACGGGTLLAGLMRRAHGSGLLLHAEGADRSGHALDIAAAACRGIGPRPPALHRLDATADDLPGGCDAIVSSLFLHHLDDATAAATLRRFGLAAPAGLVHDLVRSRPSHVLASLGCRALSRSPVVHTDGPQSVEAGFTPAELAGLARKADLPHAAVTRRLFGRLHLSWRRVPA